VALDERPVERRRRSFVRGKEIADVALSDDPRPLRGDEPQPRGRIRIGLEGDQSHVTAR
jgi:hypothetical protein